MGFDAGDAGVGICEPVGMDDDTTRDLFEGLGPVSIRRMFGGKSIYFDGMIIAIVIDGELMLKGDAQTGTAMEEAGSRRWVYSGKPGRKPSEMPYWTVPDSALDDPDEMLSWARLALEASRRSEAKR